MMITTAIRATCAFAAVTAFFMSIAAIVTGGEWALPLAGAAVFAIVAMFGAGRPDPGAIDRVEEHFNRFRIAMMVCFSTALLLYTVAAALRLPAAATLGVAFWLVAFVLAFFVVYFRGQLRLAQRAQ
jgi:hypothetical protein